MAPSASPSAADMPKLSTISHAKYAAIPVVIIRNNLRTAGMTRERYLELLASA